MMKGEKKKVNKPSTITSKSREKEVIGASIGGNYCLGPILVH
jgi:hypothetical protein